MPPQRMVVSHDQSLRRNLNGLDEDDPVVDASPENGLDEENPEVDASQGNGLYEDEIGRASCRERVFALV